MTHLHFRLELLTPLNHLVASIIDLSIRSIASVVLSHSALVPLYPHSLPSHACVLPSRIREP